MSLPCIFLGLSQNLCLGRPGWGPGVCISWVSVASGPGTTLWAPGSRAVRTGSRSRHQKRAEDEGGSTEAGRRRHAAKGWGLAQTVRMSRSPQIYKKEGVHGRQRALCVTQDSKLSIKQGSPLPQIQVLR